MEVEIRTKLWFQTRTFFLLLGNVTMTVTLWGLWSSFVPPLWILRLLEMRFFVPIRDGR